MSVQERRDALKKHLINYLNICEGKKCQRDKIWVEMSQYLKKSLSRKMYGVEKMNDLLEDFGDVILEKDGYIFLESSFTELEEKKPKKQRPVLQTDARPSKSVDTFLQTNPGTRLTKTHNALEASVIIPAMSEPLQDEPLGFGIENDFPSLHTSKALAKASPKKTRNKKQQSLKDSDPNIQMASHSSSVGSEIPTAVSKLTVGHSVVNVHDYGAAEWPDMSVRMGKAPGTKLEIKDISVPSISLTKGARLTDADVNQQIKYCIETLNTAKEHVTLQAVENLLLKMYEVMKRPGGQPPTEQQETMWSKRIFGRVKAFHQLNLPERFFNSMPAAKEHQMLLSKVLVYIQTFVRSRSLCTLYELEESCREFHSERKSFDHLKLGPLQKIPVVWTYFKFPLDEIIPEITSVDVIEHLFNFLNKYDKWTQRINTEDFMKYLADIYGVDQPYSLGLRVGSLPLAIQMLKKSQRDVSEARRNLREDLKLRLCQDIKDAVQSFHDSLLKNDESCGQTLRLHYLTLSPEDTVQEIFLKFEVLIAAISDDPNKSNQSKVKKLLKDINQFITGVLNKELHATLFHLSVCLSNLEVSERAEEFLQIELMNKQKDQAEGEFQTYQQREIKSPPPKGEVLEKILHYLNRYLKQGHLNLSNLKHIEKRVAEDLDFETFQDIGYGTFLDTITNEEKIKKVLEESGGTMQSSAGWEQHSMYRPCLKELLQFISQVKASGVTELQHIENLISEHYHVNNLHSLGHGSTAHLYSAADKPDKNSSTFMVHFEAALLGKSSLDHIGHAKFGIHGHVTREAAMACLTSCPMLDDLAEWSQWSLVFQPQHGRLRDFIEKYGLETVSIEGGCKTASSDFKALEVEPGKFLKLCSSSTNEHFRRALEAGDPLASAGHLVSIIVANKGLESTPLALLSSHVKSKLISLHALTVSQRTPGGPPSLEPVNLAVQFVTYILLRLPIRICEAVANQVLLGPLSEVVGSAKSKNLIFQACTMPGQQQRIELIGSLLGVKEWTTGIEKRFEFPLLHVINKIPDDLLGQSDDEEYNPDVNTVEESSESDTDEMLSDIEDKTEGQKEEEVLTEGEITLKETIDPKCETSFPSDSCDTKISGTGQANSLEDNEEMLTLEEKCHLIVEEIRREEFGVGIHLDETGQKLMKKQQERQGRSLQRLSKDLYSKETHFVLELIQNADDNSYAEDILPSVKFVIDHTGVTVLNNELGFEEQNIRAICDVGKSTKSKHKYGYIGQKGIGFKSVFRVTSCPEVHSNGFHIYFDVDSGPMGYILPHWSAESEENTSWKTRIALPWTEDIKQQVQTHAARFNDIQPSLLLFLHRLKEISIDNKVENSEMFMQRKDLVGGEIQISHTHGTDRWLVLKKILDASNLSLKAKSGVEVESTELALAFPLRDKKLALKSQSEKLPVFAFLPLRSYGFRFIIQADFDVPSSREDVDRDSSWNQWLRDEIPGLFIEVFEKFMERPDFTTIQALIQYLQFIPLEGDIMGFFKPVATHVLALLRAKEFMPVVSQDKNNIQWKMPSKTVITHDSLVVDIISPEMLQLYLDLYYLHPDVAAVLNEPLTQALGIESVTTEHLLHIGRSISQNWSQAGNTDCVAEIAKWLACIYRSLDDFHENASVIDSLQKMKIIPMTNGGLASLSETTVFLLSNEHDKSSKKKRGKIIRDPVLELKKDLNLVHSELTNTSDDEVNSQVIKLLIKMGIKQLTAHDLIHSHIMPVLKSDLWKDKHRDILVSYLVYIKMEMERNPSLMDMAELCSVVRLATNHGIKSPSEEAVHFSTAYGNRIDLNTTFPGLDWILLDASYLPIPPTQKDIQSWRSFFSGLGVVDFLKVKKIDQRIDSTTILETPWDECRSILSNSSGTCTVTDFQCEEFQKLVKANQRSHDLQLQMVKLFGTLETEWDGVYKHFQYAQLKSSSGQILKKDLQSTFAVQLKSLAWVPAQQTLVRFTSQGSPVDIQTESSLEKPNDLYLQVYDVKRWLAYTVKYLDILLEKSSPFTIFLQIKYNVSVEDVVQAIISWCDRESNCPDTPRIFCTTCWHFSELYMYLDKFLSGKDRQDLFHNKPAIFIPIPTSLASAEFINEKFHAGMMMKREEVCWSDPSELFSKYQESLDKFKSPLRNLKILMDPYPKLKEVFVNMARIEMEPSTFHLAQLVQHITTVYSQSEKDVLDDILFLFSKIGLDLNKIEEKEAGVMTPLAQKATINLPKVMDLLKESEVFPTHRGQWVSIKDKPMIANSEELEKVFSDLEKHKYHLLKLETKSLLNTRNKNKRGLSNTVDQESLDYFIGLFSDIKPFSECVSQKVITTGFKECSKAQTFLHNIVGPLQRFMHSAMPDVYDEIKQKSAASLKSLKFCQVESLQVIYELKDRPDISEIKDEKCIIDGNYLYIHEKFVSNHMEFSKAIARFLPIADKQNIMMLINFLQHALLIQENKSGSENIEKYLEDIEIETLPKEEEIWEVPLPMISVPLEAASESETMIYGKGLSTLDAEDDSNDGAESHGSTSWPPKSGFDRDQTSTNLKDHTPTMWPPPQAPQGLVSKHHPSVNIVFEEAPSERDLETLIKEGTVVVEDKSHRTEEVLREDITTGVLKRPNSMEEAMSQIVRSQGSRDRDNKVSPGPDDAGDARHKDREVNMTSSKFDPAYLKQERKNMTFSIPLWNDNSNELVYTELASAGTLNIDLQELSATAPSSEVGQWGEQFVLEYLRQQMRSSQNIHSVEWANSDGEKGLPYDFIVKYRTNEPDKLRTVYVEVKATVCWDKDIFPISSNQIELAFNQKDQFQILRVYGAGSLNSKLVLIENVADLMWKQQIHLFMVI